MIANSHDHNIEIPSLAASTPAPSIVNPLSLTPEVCASLIGPPAPSSTLTATNSYTSLLEELTSSTGG